MGHAGGVGGDLLQLPHDPRGPFVARPLWQRGIDQQIALVLLGDEADRHGCEAEVSQPHQGHIDPNHHDRNPQEHADHHSVDTSGHFEKEIE